MLCASVTIQFRAHVLLMLQLVACVYQHSNNIPYTHTPTHTHTPTLQYLSVPPDPGVLHRVDYLSMIEQEQSQDERELIDHRQGNSGA